MNLNIGWIAYGLAEDKNSFNACKDLSIVLQNDNFFLFTTVRVFVH